MKPLTVSQAMGEKIEKKVDPKGNRFLQAAKCNNRICNDAGDVVQLVMPLSTYDKLCSKPAKKGAPPAVVAATAPKAVKVSEEFHTVLDHKVEQMFLDKLKNHLTVMNPDYETLRNTYLVHAQDVAELQAQNKAPGTQWNGICERNGRPLMEYILSVFAVVNPRGRQLIQEAAAKRAPAECLIDLPAKKRARVA